MFLQGFRTSGKLKRWLTTAAMIITVQGMITFSLFIFEESLQVIMFGTWPAKNAKQWDIVLEGSDMMASTNIGMKVINYTIGWFQPLAFFSYRAYGKSTDYYIKSLRAEVFANAPELLVGREVEITFKPSRKFEKMGLFVYINRNIQVHSKVDTPLGSFRVVGHVVKKGRFIIIKDSVISVAGQNSK
jgi:hypothetical protein